MQIRVLGCSGSIAAGRRTTAFLVGEHVLVDAGTGVGDLTLEELERIEHIFVTHSHLDHVLALGLLADSVTRRRAARAAGPVTVHALPETLAALRQHIFNGVIWPDFTRLPSPDLPVLRLEAHAVGDSIEAAGVCIEVLPAAHTVPACGYAVRTPQSGGGAWVFTGDTGPNPALWARLRQLRVASLVIETAFRNDEHALATVSQHLCPEALRNELAQFDTGADVWITHIKPGEVETVMREIGAQGSRHRIRALEHGQRIALD